MAGKPVHGREGVLYLSTSTGSTANGTEVAWTNDWTWSPSKDQTEITPLNNSSKYYVEGLVGGSVSASGSLITGSAIQRKIINRFAKVDATTGAALNITDGNFYLHLISKPIDTGASSDAIKGQKFIVPVLASGFSVSASGGDIVGWSYDGTQNGDVLFVESSSTAKGLPKKIYSVESTST